jgi:hypothetical protein
MEVDDLHDDSVEAEDEAKFDVRGIDTEEEQDTDLKDLATQPGET